MKSADSKYWWTFLLRGCIAVMFGFIAFFWIPILELGLVFKFIGVYIFLQGILVIIGYLMINKNLKSLPVLIESILGITVGTFLFQVTQFHEASLIVTFIVWGVGTGICKVIRASFLYRDKKFYIFLGINGLISIFFNIAIYIQDKFTITPLAGILSIYFVVYGTLLLIFAIKLKTTAN